MDTINENNVNLISGTFWKAFLKVFLLFQFIKSVFMFSTYSLMGEIGTANQSLYMLIDSIFSLIHIMLAIVVSFIVTFSVSKRLINKNPKSVFGFGLWNLFLIFFFLPLPSSVFLLLLSDGKDFTTVFLFWISTSIVIFIWLYLSTLWLYKSYNAELCKNE